MSLDWVGCQLRQSKLLAHLQSFFSNKVNENVRKTVIDSNNVYNGKCKLKIEAL